MDFLKEIGFADWRSVRVGENLTVRVKSGVSNVGAFTAMPEKKQELVKKTFKAIKRVRQEEGAKSEALAALLKFAKALLPPDFVDLVGAVPWSGGIALARHLDSTLHASEEAPCTVSELVGRGKGPKIAVELGCGAAALPSIICQRKGFIPIATDIEDCLPAARENLETNLSEVCKQRGLPATRESSNGCAVVAKLEWGKGSVTALQKLLGLSDEHFRNCLVVGADVIYNPESSGVLLDTVEEFCNFGATVLFATKSRRQLLPSFLAQAEGRGMKVVEEGRCSDEDLQCSVVFHSFSRSPSC
eukprot:CAMPEP_0113913530 /NCGR_PEP_ID=MMETSP0780_2-20120614/29618_1 /TAXON_ID=652834 /ORGANISM="Palpitomonas bilix" /LENGTH=301 /DNA_ID=CAMNT_0000910779 /DNA_START=243 /DNA_END=1148 /DNA_ORIENTATION=- /assembly_acc=CAM_ASM_000599